MPREFRSRPKILQRARELRHEATPAEARLWSRLRLGQLEGVRFRRQHAISRYIVDFCSPSRKLIIELDGGQHLLQQEEDAERTRLLEARGFRVLRFWNNEVMNDLEGVLRAIERAVEDSER